jgi:hypothetical protein
MGWPDPADFVDPSWDDELERQLVLHHLTHGMLREQYRGYSWCRLCGLRENGASEVTDNTYVWPEGLAHYVSEHSVRLPQEFVDHVLTVSATRFREMDTSWWRLQRGSSDPG